MRATLTRPLLLVSICLVLIGSANCGSEHPYDPPGNRISGTLYYQGTAHENLITPAAGVFAYTTPPLEMGTPNASVLVLGAELPEEGVPFEFRYLDPYEYTVFGAVIDLDNPDATPEALGAYPDVCSFMFDPVKVEVTEDQALVDIDVHIYENLGFEDPCF